MQDLRLPSISSIQYIIIQKETEDIDSINFPLKPSNSIYHYLQHFPRDFMQFHD